MSQQNSGSRGITGDLLQNKKKWLRDKVEEIRTSYTDTFCAFRNNLDSFVAEPINVANTLLDRSDNGLTFQEIAAAGIYLEDCNRRLFDLFISQVPTGANNGANGHGGLLQMPRLMDDFPAILPHSEAVHIVTVPQMNDNYMQLEEASAVVQRSGLRYNSENESGPFEPIPAVENLDDNNIIEERSSIQAMSEVPPATPNLNLTLSSLPQSDEDHSTPKREKETRKKHSPVRNIKVPDSADSLSEISTLEGASSRNIYSYSSEDLDANVFRGTVSDVVSPYRFSIQPGKNLPRIKKLQKDLNRFYEHQTEELLQLEFSSAPRLGEYCAVVYQPDNNWYRACVIELLSKSIVVEYIDYGNMDEVPWTAALKLHSRFSQLPRQAICCSLAGVKPVSMTKSNNEWEWNNHAIEWFDKFVYGRSYEVVKIENQTSPMKTEVNLFFTEHYKDKSPELKSVMGMLINLKLAVYSDEENVVKLDQKDLIQLKLNDEKQFVNNVVGNSGTDKKLIEDNISAQTKSVKLHGEIESGNSNGSGDAKTREDKVNRSIDNKTSNTKSSVLSCIPAGMERSYNKALNAPKCTNVRSVAVSCVTSGNSQMQQKISIEKVDTHPADREVHSLLENRFLTPTSSISPVQVNDSKTCGEEKKMSEWDPMVEDYESARNSYAVNDESACMATEGFDPERIQICPHFIRGRCWNGDKCPLSHPSRSPNGELRNEITTFSASTLASLDMKTGSWSVVRLTAYTSIDNFYVHVVKLVENMRECIRLAHNISGLPVVSQEIATLMTDMKQFYSQSTRRLKDLIRPCSGEMYAVHVPEENCFYRGMVLDVSYSTASFTTANVHLVDFGRNLMVLERYLHPMCAAFMHLPKQAVHCSLYVTNISNTTKLEKISSSTDAPHLAMKVNNKCEKTDGPLHTTLYMLDKDGLHHIMS